MESISRKRSRRKEQGEKIPEKLVDLFKNIGLSLILLSLFFVPQKGQSQTWSEIFRQKKTQQKYLLEQIAALQVYSGYLKKGYEIVHHGLDTIEDFTGGEFSLHKGFISSLKAVNPLIRNNSKVAEIIGFQVTINKRFHTIDDHPMLSLHNQLYIREVKEGLLKACSDDMEELLLVITANKLEMTDDERIRRLDKVYMEMQDKSAFSQYFTNQVSQLIQQRIKEHQSINHLKELYGTDD